MNACEQVLQFGGLGHTCVIFSKDESRIREYGMRMPAFRVLVNTASPQGSTGITTNVSPSMTLGCGAIAGNITSDNVGPQHLINKKRIAYMARKASDAFQVPAELLRSAPKAALVSAPVAAPVGKGSELAVPTQRQAVAAAVESYLRARGIALTAAPGSAPTPPPATSASGPARVDVAALVDRFLASRPSPAPITAPKASGCGCSLPAAKPGAQAPSCGAPSQAPADAVPSSQQVPSPQPAFAAPSAEPAVDFACEDDVRRAIQAKRKIHLKRNAIITPSARDLGETHGVFLREGE